MIDKFNKISLPLVMKVFPELVVNDLVGVQPMFTPEGFDYHLTMKNYDPHMNLPTSQEINEIAKKIGERNE